MQYVNRIVSILAVVVAGTGCNLFEDIEEPIGAAIDDDAGDIVSGDMGTTLQDTGTTQDTSQPSCALDETYRERIDPRRTFLRTRNDPDALDAFEVSVAALGLEAGDNIRIRLIGFYEAGGQRGRSEGGIGVFSENNDFRPSFFRDRLPGAIDAGEDIETLPTHNGNEPTDIDEDFTIDDIVISIPSGASYLFVGAHDSRYSDNFSSDDEPFTLLISCP